MPTIAQSPETCAVDGMPRSAVALGCVDHVLDPEEISRFLLRLTEVANGRAAGR